MNGLLDWWERRCSRTSAVRFGDVNLRAIGQVMFQDHPLSGMLFFIAIGWDAYAAAAPAVAIGGVVALVVATSTAHWLQADDAHIRAGLLGFNGYLVGLALATFMQPSATMWVCVALGGAMSTIALLAIANVRKTWSVPALTAPFVLVAWLLLLATNAFGGLDSVLPPGAHIVPSRCVGGPSASCGRVRRGDASQHLPGLPQGQRHRRRPARGGTRRQLARRCGVGHGGAVVAVATAHSLGAESELVSGGLMGFSPVLTAVALGAMFHAPGLRGAVYAVLGTIFTVFVQGALNAVVTPFAIPTLTAPFVLATWLFRLARPKLD